MGQQSGKTMCHTQEIAFEGATEEWQAVDEWSEDKAVTPSNTLEAAPSRCRSCCVPSESKVEEVLVVHHEALQKINFLLRHDELQACETPSIPECVMAMRRARIQKRLHGNQRGGWGVNAENRQAGGDADPSDDEGAPLAGEAPRFENEARSFDGLLTRLRENGISMKALRPSPSEGAVACEDAAIRLLPSKPPQQPSFSLLCAGVERRVPMSGIVCVTCETGPTADLTTGTGACSSFASASSQKANNADIAQKVAESNLLDIFKRCDQDHVGKISKEALATVCQENPDVARFFGLPGQIRVDDGSSNLLESFLDRLVDAEGHRIPAADGDKWITWADFKHFYEREVTGGYPPGHLAASMPALHDALEERHEKQVLVYLAITQAAANSASIRWQREDELAHVGDGDAFGCPRHLLFARSKDSEEFKAWVRQHHGSQLIDLTDPNAMATARAFIGDEADSGVASRVTSRLKPETTESM